MDSSNAEERALTAELERYGAPKTDAGKADVIDQTIGAFQRWRPD